MNEEFGMYIVRPPNPVEVGVDTVIGFDNVSRWLAKPPLKGILKPKKNDLLLAFYEDLVVAYAYVVNGKDIRVFLKKTLEMVPYDDMDYRYAWQMAWEEAERPSLLHALAVRDRFTGGARHKEILQFVMKLNLGAFLAVENTYRNTRDFSSSVEMKFAELLPKAVQYLQQKINGHFPTGMDIQLRRKIEGIHTDSLTYNALQNLFYELSNFIYKPNNLDTLILGCDYAVASQGGHGLDVANRMRSQVSTLEFLTFLSEHP